MPVLYPVSVKGNAQVQSCTANVRLKGLTPVLLHAFQREESGTARLLQLFHCELL